jgi:hypothetical protein
MSRGNVGRWVIWLAVTIVLVGVCCGAGQPRAGNSPASVAQTAAGTRTLPAFIPAVRAYSGAGFDDFQRRTLKELGTEYVQGLVDLTWGNLRRGEDFWKWVATDEQMDQLARSGLKAIPLLICPKSLGLPWDETITRTDPRFVAAYGEFAYQVVKRYHDHPAWSGLVAVIGGSSDVFGESPFHAPEVQVPLLNAAYEGVKRADPGTIVAGFNLSTSISTPRQWEQWFERAFALHPEFDWFGVHTYHEPVTTLDSPEAYEGVVGLANVRKFLDRHGYADKPLWLNEGGFNCGTDRGGLPEQVHAEQTVEAYIVSRTLDVNLRGWVYFEYFSKTHLFEESAADPGLMTSLDQHNPPQPRPAWRALQTLIKTVRFFDYDFDARLSGEYNVPSSPFVYRFRRRDQPAERLWVVFSARANVKTEPASQNVLVNIAPASQATLIDMLGVQKPVHADASGNVAVTATSSPVYLKAGERHTSGHVADDPCVGIVPARVTAIPKSFGLEAATRNSRQPAACSRKARTAPPRVCD